MKSHSNLGYLVPEFPGQTHIFFWREINAIRELGIDVKILSTQMGNIDEVKHDFAIPASKETYYLHPPKIRFLFKALSKPIWLLRCLKYVASLETNYKERIKLLYFILMAAGVLCFCKENNLKHIHGHSCASVAHILAMAALSKELTFSLTLHGGLNIYGDNHQHKMRDALFVATVTKPLQHEVNKSTGIPYRKIPVIPMGVNLDKFSSEKRVFDSDKPLHFITIARLSIGKGHSYSLQALQRIKKGGFDFTFTIVGDGPDRSVIELEVKQLDLEDKVHFTGSLSENEVLLELKKADILLLTSFGEFEAAPVCVMEAMASGIPTITSIIGGTRDMIDHHENGFLVEQYNVDQIEQAMLSFFEDRSLVETMGIEARKKAESCFNFRQHAQSLLDNINQTTDFSK